MKLFAPSRPVVGRVLPLPTPPKDSSQLRQLTTALLANASKDARLAMPLGLARGYVNRMSEVELREMGKLFVDLAAQVRDAMAADARIAGAGDHAPPT